MGKRYRLSRDVSLTFRGHSVRAKAGSPVLWVPGGTGGYSLDPHGVETDSDTSPGTIWDHDTDHYHIWAPLDAVEEAPEGGAR
jgi:hypothetical protein